MNEISQVQKGKYPITLLTGKVNLKGELTESPTGSQLTGCWSKDTPFQVDRRNKFKRGIVTLTIINKAVFIAQKVLITSKNGYDVS